MDQLPEGAPVPKVEYDTCGECHKSIYRGISSKGWPGPWHHHDPGANHTPTNSDLP